MEIAGRERGRCPWGPQEKNSYKSSKRIEKNYI
jgi:hypothetical protein